MNLYRIKVGWTEPVPHWLEPVGTTVAEPTEEMIEAGADAFHEAREAYIKAQPKGFCAIVPLMVTLRAAYKAMAQGGWKQIDLDKMPNVPTHLVGHNDLGKPIVTRLKDGRWFWHDALPPIPSATGK